MRLINTSNLQFEEFIGKNIPKYAILSHRWEDREFTYKDWLATKNIKAVLDKNDKIRGCCKQAEKDGHTYVWIDSCCIDKFSSAELSEAINSMFKWYQNAKVCYAYLSDVSHATAAHSREDSEFRQSKWFTRGWTLQELLAPSELQFFDREWKPLRVSRSSRLVSQITGIKYLKNYQKCSVAQKMSWASKRETTREEDMAYCLLGLFSVNMPPLYGEGEKAFLRLQMEIIRMSDDESIFAWTSDKSVEGGLLAISPAAFRDSGNVIRLPSRDPSSYIMTNRGLSMNLCLIKHWNSATELSSTMIAPLECIRNQDTGLLAVLLRKSGKTTMSEHFQTSLSPCAMLAMPIEMSSAHLSMSNSTSRWMQLTRIHYMSSMSPFPK